MNRDERDDRPAALPPQWREVDGGLGRAIWPTDAKGGTGGTWIAATTRGLVLALMNVSEAVAAAPDVSYRAHDKLSRGGIIPGLVGAKDFDATMIAAREIRHGDYPPFQLVVFARDGTSLQTGVVRWNGVEPRLHTYRGGHACFASSGLGDHLVQHRLSLFEDMLANDTTSPSMTQDNFHRHQWHDAPHLSVLMRRQGHRTVSITTAAVLAPTEKSRDFHVEMFYDSLS